MPHHRFARCARRSLGHAASAIALASAVIGITRPSRAQQFAETYDPAGHWRALVHPLEVWSYLDLEPNGEYRLWTQVQTSAANPKPARVYERGRWKMQGNTVRELCFRSQEPPRLFYNKCGTVRVTRTLGQQRARLEWRASDPDFEWLAISAVQSLPALYFDEKRGTLERMEGVALFRSEVDAPAVLDTGNREPSYPVELQRSGVGGRVLLELEVDTTGRADPRTITVMEATHPTFSTAAVASAREWRFSPAKFDGKPVRQMMELNVRFAAPRRMSQPILWIGSGDEWRVPLFEDDVDRPVAPDPKSPHPEYPRGLLDSYVEGEIVAQFIVDTLGRVEVPSFRVVKATHADFLSAVGKALPRLRFIPAEKDGQKVRQVVQQPFEFYIRK
jgi:TonB family protein